MESFEPTTLIPLALYYLFFFLDAYKTRKGILPDASNEANPFSRYLYRQFPRWAIALFDIALALFVTAVALSVSSFVGLWILYSFAFGHFLGFLSWTRLNVLHGKLKGKILLFLLFLLFAVICGHSLALVHMSLLNKV